MAPGEESYRVDLTGPAKQQMRELIANAAAGSARQKVQDTLLAIISRLEKGPHGWGDPERRTRLEGGLVYHAIERPFIVWYVVFEPRKVVWLLEVRDLTDPSLPE